VDVEANKRTVRRIFEEVINGGDLELADELYGDAHVLHPQSEEIGPGPAGMQAAFRGLREAFPDVVVTIESMVAEGDLVAVRLTFRGTEAATGRTAVWPEMVFTRVEGGKAIESWEVTDTGRGWDAAPW
jgi:predicted SnoaL-like aldol condensation-catalyzing enzyme